MQIKNRTNGNQNKGTATREQEGKPRNFTPSGSKLFAALFLVPGVVLDLGIDGDLHVESAVVVIWDDMAIVISVLALGVKNAALAIAINLGALLPDIANGVGLVGVGVDVENGVGGLGWVRAGGPGGRSSGVGTRVGTRERSASDERTTDGENDTHGHGGGEDGSHAV